MLFSHFVLRIISLCLLVPGVGALLAQDYPNKPLRVVTAAVGGGADLIGRLIAQGISSPLGQQVIVENRAGVSGLVAAQTVAKATPDGYTLLFYSSSVWLLPFLQDHVPYDPVRDFAPITLADTSPTILVVHPSLPVASIKELIALARAKPGQLNYASAGSGGSAHLAAELFKAMAGVNIVHIAYKGAGPALNDLIGNQVQLMFPSAGGVAVHIKSGRLRALAVSGKKPSALAPELPTIAASGLPGYELESAHAVFAPAKTPEAIIKRLNQEIVLVLHRAEVKEKLMNSGVESVGSSPQQLSATMKSEMARLGKVIKDAGIRGE